MVNKDLIFEYIRDKYQVFPDYPWSRHPDHAVFRHPSHKIWFCLSMAIEANKLGLDDSRMIEVINLKIQPELIGGLLHKKGIYPAYHMNKDHWISLNLAKVEKIDEVKVLIDQSYDLTR